MKKVRDLPKQIRHFSFSLPHFRLESLTIAKNWGRRWKKKDSVLPFRFAKASLPLPLHPTGPEPVIRQIQS